MPAPSKNSHVNPKFLGAEKTFALLILTDEPTTFFLNEALDAGFYSSQRNNAQTTVPVKDSISIICR